MADTIFLQLEDGTCLAGKSFGAPLKEDVIAEVVFTTAMTGYVETLTDPSYYGQMVIQTFPLIGNYGVNPEDFESKHIHMSAYLTREHCIAPSNFRCEFDLDSFLKKEGIPGIYDLDTRALTRKIRQQGVMIGALTKQPFPAEKLSILSDWTVRGAVKSVTCEKQYKLTPDEVKHHVVLMDFGAKDNIARELNKLGCDLTVVPANTTCEEIIKLNPDGIMLSNGPGDPKENVEVIAELRKLCEHKVPTFGICLGHQLLALANGLDTTKLKYGHRGANQPVKDLTTGKTYITSQNHGYAVKTQEMPACATVTFTNINDDTCEGITYNTFPGFSVQFHPEACGGPHDTNFLFRRFIDLMEGGNN